MLRRFYRALEAKHGPFDEVGREYGRLAAEAWWGAVAASGEALGTVTKRRYGKGRRPSVQMLDRRLKRQGLGATTFDALVKRLEELGAGASQRTLASALKAHGNGNGIASPAKQLARKVSNHGLESSGDGEAREPRAARATSFTEGNTGDVTGTGTSPARGNEA
jgi:hypothetical protein